MNTNENELMTQLSIEQAFLKGLEESQNALQTSAEKVKSRIKELEIEIEKAEMPKLLASDFPCLGIWFNSISFFDDNYIYKFIKESKLIHILQSRKLNANINNYIEVIECTLNDIQEGDKFLVELAEKNLVCSYYHANKIITINGGKYQRIYTTYGHGGHCYKIEYAKDGTKCYKFTLKNK